MLIGSCQRCMCVSSVALKSSSPARNASRKTRGVLAMMRLEAGADLGRCLCCGSHVTPKFRRGFGGDRNRAHRCTTCDIYKRLSAGSAAGKDLDIPDPLENPTRFQSPFEDLPNHGQRIDLGGRVGIGIRSLPPSTVTKTPRPTTLRSIDRDSRCEWTPISENSSSSDHRIAYLTR